MKPITILFSILFVLNFAVIIFIQAGYFISFFNALAGIVSIGSAVDSADK